MSQELLNAAGARNYAPYGDIKKVEELIKAGADLAFVDLFGRNALHYAASIGDTNIVRLLLNKGAVVDVKDGQGNTALMLAAGQGCLETVTILLEWRANILERSTHGRTTLIFAALATRRNADVVKLLLDKGAVAVIDAKEHERSALNWAVELGHSDIVKLLLEHGANILDEGEMVKGARSPSHEDTLSLLLKRGAIIDINDINRWRCSDERCSLSTASADLFKVAAMKSGKDEKESMETKHKNDIMDCLTFLGNAVNARRKEDGNTALHLAIQNRHKFLIYPLIKHGASLTLENHEGKTALKLAKEFQDYFIISLQKVHRLELLSTSMQSGKASKELQAEFEGLDKQLQADLFSLDAQEKSDICYKLGMIYYRLSPLHYARAYSMLVQVDRSNQFYKEARKIMLELLFDYKVILRRDSLTDEPIATLGEEEKIKNDSEEYRMRLRVIAHCRLLLDPTDSSACQMAVEYIEPSWSVRGLPGFVGVDVDSTMVLVEQLREAREAKLAAERNCSKAQAEILKLRAELSLYSSSGKLKEEADHSEKRTTLNANPPHAININGSASTSSMGAAAAAIGSLSTTSTTAAAVAAAIRPTSSPSPVVYSSSSSSSIKIKGEKRNREVLESEDQNSSTANGSASTSSTGVVAAAIGSPSTTFAAAAASPALGSSASSTTNSDPNPTPQKKAKYT